MNMTDIPYQSHNTGVVKSLEHPPCHLLESLIHMHRQTAEDWRAQFPLDLPDLLIAERD